MFGVGVESQRAHRRSRRDAIPALTYLFILERLATQRSTARWHLRFLASVFPPPTSDYLH